MLAFGRTLIYVFEIEIEIECTRPVHDHVHGLYTVRLVSLHGRGRCGHVHGRVTAVYTARTGRVHGCVRAVYMVVYRTRAVYTAVNTQANFVLDGTYLLPQKRGTADSSAPPQKKNRPMSIVAKRLDGSKCHLVRR